jgi:hypothetical protein
VKGNFTTEDAENTEKKRGMRREGNVGRSGRAGWPPLREGAGGVIGRFEVEKPEEVEVIGGGRVDGGRSEPRPYKHTQRKSNEAERVYRS